MKIEDNPFYKKSGISDWLTKKIQIPSADEYLVSGLVPADILACLQTNGVYGKTTLALQLAMAVAFDLPFLGQYPCLQSGRVLYLGAGDTEDDNFRRFKRITREWSALDPNICHKVEQSAHNLSCISMYDECLNTPPHLVDASGTTTRTYSYLYQYVEYFKPKLVVLDAVEDFFPENLKSGSDLYRKLRQLNAAVLLISNTTDRFDAMHGVEVGLFLNEKELLVKSFYEGIKHIPLEMEAGIWVGR
jgi:RecA-family ATPase